MSAREQHPWVNMAIMVIRIRTLINIRFGFACNLLDVLIAQFLRTSLRVCSMEIISFVLDMTYYSKS